jgi:hypothetical protein
MTHKKQMFTGTDRNVIPWLLIVLLILSAISAYAYMMR